MHTLWDQPNTSNTSLAAPRHELHILASSSSGNCSILTRGKGPLRRFIMIDAGLSPLRTGKLLAAIGLSFDRMDAILFTHFDADHCYAGWSKRIPPHVRAYAHAGHRSCLNALGLPPEQFQLFDGPFELRDGLRVTPIQVAHDALGSAAFRFDGLPQGASLGYATDLGRVPQRLIDEFSGVSVLALESNYCPVMQKASRRSEHLKRRIMDGAGHLSNEQCRDAVRAIAPREAAVLLHLSRECNTPQLAASYHRGSPYRVFVGRPYDSVGPIPLGSAIDDPSATHRASSLIEASPAAIDRANQRCEEDYSAGIS